MGLCAPPAQLPEGLVGQLHLRGRVPVPGSFEATIQVEEPVAGIADGNGPGLGLAAKSCQALLGYPLPALVSSLEQLLRLCQDGPAAAFGECKGSVLQVYQHAQCFNGI